MVTEEIKSYKYLSLPSTPIKNAVLYVLDQNTNVVNTYITDLNGVPIPLKDLSGSFTGVQTVTNLDGSITVSGLTTTPVVSISASMQSLINGALQSGDNISELVNDANYITLGDIPAFDPSNYDLTDFTNLDADPFARISDLSTGATNLSYTPSPTNGTVNSDNGTDAVIPLADATNAGLITAAEKTSISTAIQPGDNVSELVNDSAYITASSLPANTSDLTNNGADNTSTYVETDELGTTAFTNDYNDLDNLPILNSGTVTSVAVSGSDGIEIDSGSPITTNGTIALGINASTLRAHINVEDGATADQTSIVGITGTKTEFDTAVTDGNFMYVGDAPTAHVHDTADITTGTFNDARIAESNVTQHEAALTITESQISDLSHFTPTDLITDYGITLGTVATSNDYEDLDNLPVFTDAINVFIEEVEDKDYILVLRMPYGGSILKTTSQSVSGTCTATFKINSTALGGGANSVSSTEADVDHTTDNTFVEGDTVLVTISANSTCIDTSLTLKILKS